MMARLAAPFVDWLATHRRRQLEERWRDPMAVQETALRHLVARAEDTEFGLSHGFAAIRTVGDYQARVPIREYQEFRPLWNRAIAGERDITWPGASMDWVKTSGTTSGDKLIPLTREALSSHRMGGWDAFLQAVSVVGSRQLVDGHTIVLGGSTARQPLGDSSRVGDVSGLAMRRLPPGLRRCHSPEPGLARIAGWEERLEAMAALAVTQDVRMICGMPSWLISLFERVARHYRRDSGRRLRDLHQLWPRLSVLIHGGVSYAPYAPAFEEWLGRRLHRVEVYAASEGFVAVQTEPAAGLTLMLDYGIFYEFVPVEDVGSSAPRRHTVADVEIGRPYAVAMSTPGGLWSYLLGDTVRFTGRHPLRLVVTGRTRHYVNALGENVIVEEVERAMARACRRTGAEVVEFTVAPRHPGADEPCDSHEWLVEFRVPPAEPHDFARVIDESLASANTSYRISRARSIGLMPPSVTPLAAGTFHRWMREVGKLGDQHKVPRATNDRVLADALVALSGGVAQPLATPAG